MNRCLICGVDTGEATPWSLCYDPSWKTNVWGGDTHEHRGALCPSCATNIILIAQFHKDLLQSEYERGQKNGFEICEGEGNP